MLEHLQPLAPPGGIKIAPWGRAGDTIGAGGGWASSRRPQAPTRGRFSAHIRQESAHIRRGSALNSQHK